MMKATGRGALALIVAFTVVVALSPGRAAAEEPKVIAVQGGFNHSLALDSESRVWSWGGNGAGQLGDGTRTNRNKPVRVTDPGDPSGFLSGIVAVSASSFSAHSLALKADGTVWAWGGNGQGQLGDGTKVNRLTPVQVQVEPSPGSIEILKDVVAIAAAGSHSMALKSDGTVWAWGANDQRQLADGTTTDRTRAVRVQDPTDPTGFLTDIGAIGGFVHSLAVKKSDGTVRAWGRNTLGQVGNGTSGAGFTPVPFPDKVKDDADPTGFLTGVIEVSAGNATSFALKGDGTVWAWGAGGQLGDGTVTSRSKAVQVVNVTGVTTISAGSFHTLARLNDGTVKAWGGNANGQIGDGTKTDRLTAVNVVSPANPSSGIHGVVAVAAGNAHSVSLEDDGTVHAWGTKGLGQLGNGEDALRPFPVQVVDSSDPTGKLTAIADVGAGGFVSMARTSADMVRAWGGNAFGQLGDGTFENRVAPVSVVGVGGSGLLTGVAAIDHGGSHALALTTDATVRAWGLGTTGQLGNGADDSSPTPVQVSALSGVVEVAAAGHSLARVDSGTVWAWGPNVNGQLGNDSRTNQNVPVQVQDKSDATGFLNGVAAIAAGDSHSLALKSDATVRSWGLNNAGQLGDGTTTRRLTAVAVQTLTNVTAIAAGGSHSLGLTSDGTVWSWGANGVGQLGDGSTANRTTPVEVQGLTGVVAIAAEGGYSLALRSDGTVWAWGANAAAQLGDGTTQNRTTPVQVKADPTTFLTGVAAIVSGFQHAVALKLDGTVWAWGSHAFGQIGDGTDPDVVIPTRALFPKHD